MKKTICLSVDVEEWFDSRWFDPKTLFAKYYNNKRPRTDIEQTTKMLLDIFEEHKITSTFFVLGRVAQDYPQLTRLIQSGDHEVATHGFSHEKLKTDEEFEDDLMKSLKILKKYSADIFGYRSPNADIDFQRLKIIAKHGFLYDSSVFPCIKIPGWYGTPSSKIEPYLIRVNKRDLCELPFAVIPFIRIPIAGGWYLRNTSYHLIRAGTRFLIRRTNYAMLYVHPWELSSNNPNHPEIPKHVFRKTGRHTANCLKNLIEDFRDCYFLTARQLAEEYLDA